MASECCISLTKYFLFLFNLVFFLLGSLLLSFGLWMLLSEGTYIFSIRLPYISISLFSYLLIIGGSLTMLLGFFGCLGSLKTVKCLLATYFLLLTVLLSAQIVGGVIFYTQTTKAADHLFNLLKWNPEEAIKSFKKNDSSLQIFDDIQKKFECCGWVGAEDWKDSVPCSCYFKVNSTNNNNETMPKPPNECNICNSSDTYFCSVYNKGCSVSIETWLNGNGLFIWVVILAISVVEICGMILSMCLYKNGSVDYKAIFY